ncbi:hypothetical protein Y032_0265g654 [Ancylostoma ceylanicum]|uniref:Tc1-like transposase DDE domain-containing protein n=1 Tax=Ancylostoma ceylanicum TaxID=53326 RepID=A0A016S9F8_9BILA|nr:hypothetical protein Y032_0265g654 [Ancylostoma ceylanicum]
MRKMATEVGISPTTVRRIVKHRLMCYPYKIQKSHLLTDVMKETRLKRCRAFLKRFSEARHRNILFTDESIFTVEQFVNHQNDRAIAESLEALNITARTSLRSGHPKSVMVFGGITANGKTPLIFVDIGTKVNTEYHLEHILKKEVLPWACSHFGSEPWTFQQDSAPAHKAKVVQKWCANTLPDFISAEDWPPYSPDLNPMDYSVWSILKAKACAKSHTCLKSLREALQKAWDELDDDYLRSTVDAFPRRLQACIKAKGGLFEI